MGLKKVTSDLFFNFFREDFKEAFFAHNSMSVDFPSCMSLEIYGFFIFQREIKGCLTGLTARITPEIRYFQREKASLLMLFERWKNAPVKYMAVA